jgi:hypothetical protein
MLIYACPLSVTPSLPFTLILAHSRCTTSLRYVQKALVELLSVVLDVRQWDSAPKGSRGPEPDTGGWGCIYKGVQTDAPVAAFGTDMTLKGEAMKLPRKQRSVINYSSQGYPGSRLNNRYNGNTTGGSHNRYGHNNDDDNDDNDVYSNDEGDSDGRSGRGNRSVAPKGLSAFADSDEENKDDSISISAQYRSNTHTGRQSQIPRSHQLGPKMTNSLNTTSYTTSNSSSTGLLNNNMSRKKRLEEKFNDSDDDSASCLAEEISDSASNLNIDGAKPYSNRKAQTNSNNFNNFGDNCQSQNDFLDKKEMKKRGGPAGRPGQQAVTAAIPIKMFTMGF